MVGRMDSEAQQGKRELSEDDTSQDSLGAKRRQPQGVTSRGVANLTPEQLAKKRANDREAQRAIRERTKNQIENLEQRILQLTSQQPYQDLQNVLRQKEAVEAENADIKRRLTSALSILQPILGQLPQPHPAEDGYAPILQSYTINRPASSNLSASTPTGVPSPNTTNSPWMAPAPPMMVDGRLYTPQKAFNQQRHDLTHGLDLGPERLGLDFLLDGTQQINKIPNGNPMSQQSPNFDHPVVIGHSTRDHYDQRNDIRVNNGPGVDSGSGSQPEEMTAHAAPIRNCSPTCPLDSILLDFLHERQKQAAEGVATQKIVGPAYPSVSSLLNPAQSVNSHPLSKVFTDILGTFPDLSTLPERVASLYVMFLVMRWQISPTQENYDRLPEWMTPRPSQLFTPHPAWIDHVPWPKMRDKLIREYKGPEYAFENFFIPFTTTLSLNWPYEATDTLLSSSDCNELMINPVFERHLRRLENWSLGPAFPKAFPGLAGTYRFKPEGDRAP